MNVVEIEAAQMMMALSEVNRVKTSDEVGITYGGGSNQAARVKANTVDWDNWEE
jgi:hypothetical protein